MTQLKNAYEITIRVRDLDDGEPEFRYVKTLDKNQIREVKQPQSFVRRLVDQTVGEVLDKFFCPKEGNDD